MAIRTHCPKDGHALRGLPQGPERAGAEGLDRAALAVEARENQITADFFLGCGPELTCGASLSHSLDATQYRQKSPWS